MFLRNVFSTSKILQYTETTEKESKPDALKKRGP